jgi:hypothetical protein
MHVESNQLRVLFKPWAGTRCVTAFRQAQPKRMNNSLSKKSTKYINTAPINSQIRYEQERPGRLCLTLLKINKQIIKQVVTQSQAKIDH